MYLCVDWVYDGAGDNCAQFELMEDATHVMSGIIYPHSLQFDINCNACDE